MTYVTTKQELQEAVKRGDPEIMITGKLAKKMKGFVKIHNLSPKKRTALIAFLGGTGAAAAAAIAAAAPTGGLSVAGASAMMLVAASTAGISMELIVTVITLLLVGGLAIIAMIKGYDFSFEGLNIKCTVKK